MSRFKRAKIMSSRERIALIARRPLLLGLPAWFAISLRKPSLAQTSSEVGKVDKVRGIATAETKVDKRILSPDAGIYDGDAISTAAMSRVEMRLGRDTTLRLGENARIKIDRFLIDAGGEITLDNGALLLGKDPNSGARPVRVRGTFGL